MKDPKPKLLKCPFCKAVGACMKSFKDKKIGTCYFVQCTLCKAKGGNYTRRETAATVWNRALRKDDDVIDAQMIMIGDVIKAIEAHRFDIRIS